MPIETTEYEEEGLPSRADLARYALEFEGERSGLPEFYIPQTGGDIYGIDVSRWQGEIDWRRVSPARVVFAVAKCSEGNGLDKKFAQNWSAMAAQRDAAMTREGTTFLRGAYHFFRVDGDPLKAADVFVRAVGRLEPGDLPPTLDVEWSFRDFKDQQDDRWDGYTKTERGRRIRQWLDAVERALGVVPMIYTCNAFWADKIGPLEDFSRYPLWLADYSGLSRQRGRPQRIPAPWQRWHVWQFSDNGQVSGIPGPVDVNRFGGAQSDLLALVRLGAPVGTQPLMAAAPLPGPNTSASITDGQTLPAAPLRRGDQGAGVAVLQTELVTLGHMSAATRATGVGNFGPGTQASVKAFQLANELPDTGEFDQATRAALLNLRDGLRKGMEGTLVHALQQRLIRLEMITEAVVAGGPGEFGPKTESAVTRFQQQYGLRTTGVVDQATYAAMEARLKS